MYSSSSYSSPLLFQRFQRNLRSICDHLRLTILLTTQKRNLTEEQSLRRAISQKRLSSQKINLSEKQPLGRDCHLRRAISQKSNLLEELTEEQSLRRATSQRDRHLRRAISQKRNLSEEQHWQQWLGSPSNGPTAVTGGMDFLKNQIGYQKQAIKKFSLTLNQ